MVKNSQTSWIKPGLGPKNSTKDAGPLVSQVERERTQAECFNNSTNTFALAKPSSPLSCQIMRVFGSPGPQTNQEKEAKICRRRLKKGKESYGVSGLAMVTVWHNRGGTERGNWSKTKKVFSPRYRTEVELVTDSYCVYAKSVLTIVVFKCWKAESIVKTFWTKLFFRNAFSIYGYLFLTAIYFENTPFWRG